MSPCSCEVCGFWLVALGDVLGVLLMVYLQLPQERSAALSQWVEERLGVSRYIQLCLPLIMVLFIFVGLHVYYLGNQGRYPGYPLDLLLQCWRDR